MNKNKPAQDNRLVYSTDPGFVLGADGRQQEPTAEPAQQTLKIRLDRKQRGGKTVTLVEGFIGFSSDLEKLTKELKTSCGTGGSTKEGTVIIQGDQREKLLSWLLQKGYKKTKLL
jgi:translation initiation factor 1